MPKNILFITWDGPQTSYMEGLFMPIFQEIAKENEVKFHVLQFTWADQKKINETQKVAEKMGIDYTTLPISRKPTASIGSLLTVFTSSSKIKKYIKENKIDIVMPRSTFPAMMVNQIKNRNFRLIFDADGLPIEERIDFAGLKTDSFQYRLMKSAESKILKNADAVITRSQKAIDIHVDTIGEVDRSKFSVVQNGRDISNFSLNAETRSSIRKKLELTDECLFIYAGSLGPQYCFPEMLQIFNQYSQGKNAQFLILTGDLEFAEKNIPKGLKIILKKVASDEVSGYLNAADVAFALRKPTFSMQGVAPIKLGEYLLMGIPTIASSGIGDTEEILKNFNDCYLYQHEVPMNKQLPEIVSFINSSSKVNKEELRNLALPYFSLEAAAESYLIAINKVL